jgi:hypothetical protein
MFPIQDFFIASHARILWINIIADAAAIVEKKGDAPTTPRLRIAPSMMTRILSNAVLIPKIRIPAIRISKRAIKNIIKALAAICKGASSSPLPKISFIFMIVVV